MTSLLLTSLSSEKSRMATVMPDDIKTEPHAKIVYNARFTEKNRYHLTITNLGDHRMGWDIKTTNMKRLGVEPPAIVLYPKEEQMVFVTCENFSYKTEDTNNDRITFEWTNAPEGAVDEPDKKPETTRFKEPRRSERTNKGVPPQRYCQK